MSNTPKKRRGTIIRGTCVVCGEDFERPSYGRTKDKRLACSSKCSGALASRKVLKHGRYAKTNLVCPLCGGKKTALASRCVKCRRGSELRLQEGMTVAEARTLFSLSAFHAKIRGYARAMYQGPMECLARGYSLHVDIAHIRPVADFPPTATIAEVNEPGNLAALDKRCHWEFDHGYLVYVNGRFVARQGLEP